MLVSRSARLKPRPWQRLVRTSSPSSSSTRWPRSASATVTVRARVDLPAPERPVSQSTKPGSSDQDRPVVMRVPFRSAGGAVLVGLGEHRRHLGPGELRWGQLAGDQHGPHLRARQAHVRVARVGAGLGGGHGAAGAAEEGVVEQQRGDAELLGGERGDQLLRLVGAVVGADAGVVPPDDEVGAAVVLAHQRMQHRLPRSGVAHRRHQRGQHHPLGREVGQHRLVGAQPHLDRHVTLLGRADQGVQEQPVAHLEGALEQVLVGAVDRVAGLERGDPAPATLGEGRPRLGRGQRVGARRPAGRSHHRPDRSGDRPGRAAQHPGNPRVGRVVGAVDELGLAFAVALEDLGDFEHAGQAALRLAQGEHAAAQLDLVGEPEADRDRPQGAVVGVHRVGAGLVGRPAHEPLERAVGPGGDRPEVRRLGRGEPQRGQPLGRLPLVRVQPPLHQPAAVGPCRPAVRRRLHPGRHVISSSRSRLVEMGGRDRAYEPCRCTPRLDHRTCRYGADSTPCLARSRGVPEPGRRHTSGAHATQRGPC